MGAGRDRGGGLADHLGEAAHRLAGGDGAQRDLVAARDRLRRHRRTRARRGTGRQILERDGDRIVGMEAEDAGAGRAGDRGGIHGARDSRRELRRCLA
jgi:hypothetical protein